MQKQRGFWTRKRKDVPRIYFKLGTVLVVILVVGGWYTVALFAAIALGAVFALLMHLARSEDEI